MEKKRMLIETPDGNFYVDSNEKQFVDTYKLIYSKLVEELDDRVQTIIFGYDDSLNGSTIQVYTKRCTLFRPSEVFNEDRSNAKAVMFEVMKQWAAMPKPEYEKEQYSGVFEGKKISFNREWGSHKFTDDECKALLEGREIQFLTTNSKGEEYIAQGKLEEQEYKGFKFFGFKASFNKSVPAEFNGHTFTKAEIQELERGGTIAVDDLVSKRTGKTYSANISFDKREGIKMFFN